MSTKKGSTKGTTSFSVNMNTLCMVRSPHKPKNLQDRIANDMFDEFTNICRQSLITDDTEKYKQSLQGYLCQIWREIGLMLFGVGFGAGGVFLIDSMSRNSKLWLLAIAIPMIIIGIILFGSGVRLMVKMGQAQKETTNGYISAIRNNLDQSLTKLNEKYNNKIHFELIDRNVCTEG